MLKNGAGAAETRILLTYDLGSGDRGRARNRHSYFGFVTLDYV